MENYPETATERFDNANFHIKYCLSTINKHIHGNILEVGAGCGSFTRNYINNKTHNIVLTEKDKKNIEILKNKFKYEKKIKVTDLSIEDIKEKFETILYFHVLEHIEDDIKELKLADERLNSNGKLIIIVPAHQNIYSRLDKAVGHFRRYEKDFFKKNLFNLKLEKFLYLDSVGYILYYLNKIFYKNETFPSKTKIFLWDKFFTPISIFFDFILNYKFGKCIIAIYKKNN